MAEIDWTQRLKPVWILEEASHSRVCVVSVPASDTTEIDERMMRMTESVQVETWLTARIEWSKIFLRKTYERVLLEKYERVLLEKSEFFSQIEFEPSVSVVEPSEFPVAYPEFPVAPSPFFVLC